MESVADGIFRVVFDINTAGLRILESVRTYWEAELEAAGSVLRGEAAPDLSTHAQGGFIKHSRGLVRRHVLDHVRIWSRADSDLRSTVRH
jgi:hypothetical protein